MMNEKLLYEQPMLQFISFDAPVMNVSGFDWSQWDEDGDGWTDGWV